jgi:hypothetical protein
MLVFVTAVKNPVNSKSYDQVWRLLNNTLFSVCSQQDTNFRVIVVCDKKLPLFHHEELIESYTEFIEVNFPGHGQEVIKNFNRLGNLSSLIENPELWNPKGWNKPRKKPLPQKDAAPKKTKRIYRKTERLFATPPANRKARQNYMSEDQAKLMANYAINRGSKQVISILAAKKYNPEYVLFFDADDYVGDDISAYVNARPGENGWLMAHGYKMAGHLVAPLHVTTTFCGTGNIVNFSLLLDDIPPQVSENSTQNELLEKVDSEFLITLARHGKFKSYYEMKGHSLLEYPFRSVVHLLGHEESNEFIRRSMIGESDSVRLKAAQKYTRFSPINSRLVGYFHIMPRNEPKVFCLGFHKTGTTSMDDLLQAMGYQVATYYKNWDAEFCSKLENGDLSEVKQISELFDAFQDAPWFLFYREFDRWYPGSKFILTIRDSRSWWESFSYYFEMRNLPLFKYIYGFENPVGHEKTFVERFERHNREVIEYFKDRPDDLLVLDVSEAGAVQKIGDFLGKATSYIKMPHKNVSLHGPVNNEIKTFKKQWKTYNKKLKQTRIAPILKMLVFSSPIIIGGSKESGAELMLSILSCHPNIHAISKLHFNYPARHPLSPDRSVKSNQTNRQNTPPVNLRRLISPLINEPVPPSVRRWCGASHLSVLVYDRLLEYYGKKVRILNMVRDGRDVVIEKDRQVMARYAVPCDRWVHDVKSGMTFENHPQVLTVRYEDLLQDYETTINRVSEFIGEQDTAPFLNYPKGATTMTDQYWIGKWQQPQFSDRVEALLQTPDALECLQHYEYE